MKSLTGEVTRYLGMVSADLGIPRWDAERGCWVLVYGDNWSDGFMRGEWRSPSIVCYNEDMDVLGVPALIDGHPVIDPNGRVRQCWPYNHNNPTFTTVLPTDLIRICGVWYLCVMVMNGLDDPNRPGSGARWIEFQQSHDLVEWVHTGKFMSPADPICTMQTFERCGDYIYVYGTGGLLRNKPIFMWRVAKQDFPHGVWETWGFGSRGWGWGNPPTPVLEGEYGELCLRRLEDGRFILSYFDRRAARCAYRIVDGPEGDWTVAEEHVIATAREYPQLYGGYYVAAGKFVISQWKTSDNSIYRSFVVDTATTELGKD